MQNKCNLPLDILWVNDLACANVLRVNDYLFMSEGFQDCQQNIQKKAGNNVIVQCLDNCELRKLDSGLTCLSVLLSV